MLFFLGKEQNFPLVNLNVGVNFPPPHENLQQLKYNTFVDATILCYVILLNKDCPLTIIWVQWMQNVCYLVNFFPKKREIVIKTLSRSQQLPQFTIMNTTVYFKTKFWCWGVKKAIYLLETFTDMSIGILANRFFFASWAICDISTLFSEGKTGIFLSILSTLIKSVLILEPHPAVHW